MRVFIIKPFPGANKCIEKDFEACKVWFEEACPGDLITVKVMDMPEEDYELLPEYMGP